MSYIIVKNIYLPNIYIICYTCLAMQKDELMLLTMNIDFCVTNRCKIEQNLTINQELVTCTQLVLYILMAGHFYCCFLKLKTQYLLSQLHRANVRVEILGLNVFRPHKTRKKTKPGHGIRPVFLLLLMDHQKLSNAINDANTKREIKDQFDYRLVRNVTVTCFQIICLDYSSHLYSRLRTNVTFMEAAVAVER